MRLSGVGSPALADTRALYSGCCGDSPSLRGNCQLTPDTQNKGLFVLGRSKLQQSVNDILQRRVGHLRIHENHRPEWLLTGECERTEIDFYVEELQLAIEVQGGQHYVWVPFFYPTQESFEAQKRRDAHKRIVCESRGLRFIEIASPEQLEDLDTLLREAMEIPDLEFDIVARRTAFVENNLRVNIKRRAALRLIDEARYDLAADPGSAKLRNVLERRILSLSKLEDELRFRYVIKFAKQFYRAQILIKPDIGIPLPSLDNQMRREFRRGFRAEDMKRCGIKPLTHH